MGKIVKYLQKHFVTIFFHRVEETALKLRAGSTNHNAGGILYPVTKYYVHPSFNKGTMDYDIAILKVKPNFAIGSTLIQTIHLPEIGYAPKDGSMVTVSGWGVLAVSKKRTRNL